MTNDNKLTTENNERGALFISHANPEDNSFTLWLGAKLSAMGYEVWADILRLKGGHDWQRRLEDALRNRASKVLLVANQNAVNKQGVRNEIQIASDVARKISDSEFIIPLRLSAFEAPFLIAHSQYINFEQSWSKGLTELLEVLEGCPAIKRHKIESSSNWKDIQLIHGKTLVAEPERLISNWLAISAAPKQIRHYGFRGQVPERKQKELLASPPWPIVSYGSGFLSFASFEDLQDHFGPNIPIAVLAQHDLENYLEQGWPGLGIRPHEARNHFTNLVRQGLEIFFKARGLNAYRLSGPHSAWWPSVDAAPKTKVAFRWGDVGGLRQIQGVSEKRKMNWHFGVSMAARTAPIRHVRIVSRIVFTEDGNKPFADPKRMHQLRRSFAKTWRNARWRDMLLAFLHWLSEGKEQIEIAMSSEEHIVLTLPPVSFFAPVSLLIAAEDAEDDEDDPSDDEDDVFEMEEAQDDISNGL